MENHHFLGSSGALKRLCVCKAGIKSVDWYPRRSGPKKRKRSNETPPINSQVQQVRVAMADWLLWPGSNGYFVVGITVFFRPKPVVACGWRRATVTSNKYSGTRTRDLYECASADYQYVFQRKRGKTHIVAKQIHEQTRQPRL